MVSEVPVQLGTILARPIRFVSSLFKSRSIWINLIRYQNNIRVPQFHKRNLDSKVLKPVHCVSRRLRASHGNL